ncbi:lipid-A-disaccharide synthase N-terminal domain-containing protein [Paracoccus jiaweipingae]|uniref:lipid-A-disaccharide synthase N-terminal domain-containing protein n=1 Tax=unclassified Paracoccus (in: a-proteobacteria) TaxID=2688777 RepID=UPI0037B1B311
MIEWLRTTFSVESTYELVWVMVGLVAQMMFTFRFVIQWLASERARQSVVPVAFWYFSLAGGLTLLAYAIHRGDPVFILGQSLGAVIYIRNLWLIHAHKNSPLGK